MPGLPSMHQYYEPVHFLHLALGEHRGRFHNGALHHHQRFCDLDLMQKHWDPALRYELLGNYHDLSQKSYDTIGYPKP